MVSKWDVPAALDAQKSIQTWFHHFTHLIMHYRHLPALNLVRLLYYSEEKNWNLPLSYWQLENTKVTFGILKSHLLCRWKQTHTGCGLATEWGLGFSKEKLQNLNSEQTSHKVPAREALNWLTYIFQCFSKSEVPQRGCMWNHISLLSLEQDQNNK